MDVSTDASNRTYQKVLMLEPQLKKNADRNGSIAKIQSNRNNQKREISMRRFKRLFD